MKTLRVIFCVMLCGLVPSVSFSHSGHTDRQGGHWNRSNNEYHYHNGGSSGGLPSDGEFILEMLKRFVQAVDWNEVHKIVERSCVKPVEDGNQNQVSHPTTGSRNPVGKFSKRISGAAGFLLPVFMLLMAVGAVVGALQALWRRKFFLPQLWSLSMLVFVTLWRKKLFVPTILFGISRLPKVLNVDRITGPSEWYRKIPRGLLCVNILLWIADLVLALVCLNEQAALAGLVPMLVLSYYFYLGAKWVRIVLTILCVLFTIVAFAGPWPFAALMILVVVVWLPKSNEWFRVQNGDFEAR